jgi:indole-3-glycerol phosphate synthase
MSITLDHLVAEARRRAVEARSAANLSALMRKSEAHVPRGFKDHLQQVAKSRSAVIAELKKSSPSRGLIRDPFHVGSLASQLAIAGAAALSVLTEERYFLGSLNNLVEASAATDLPCLRKDFIVDQFQILEARAHHADAILLIVAALSEPELAFLFTRAKESGLDVLVEVHNESELDRAIAIGADIIGVNNRDLKTFEVSLDTGARLAERIPGGVLRVAESGIHDAQDISMLRSAGFHAFLIGESLMRADRPGDMLRQLLNENPAAQGTIQ